MNFTMTSAGLVLDPGPRMMTCFEPTREGFVAQKVRRVIPYCDSMVSFL